MALSPRSAVLGVAVLVSLCGCSTVWEENERQETRRFQQEETERQQRTSVARLSEHEVLNANVSPEEKLKRASQIIDGLFTDCGGEQYLGVISATQDNDMRLRYNVKHLLQVKGKQSRITPKPVAQVDAMNGVLARAQYKVFWDYQRRHSPSHNQWTPWREPEHTDVYLFEMTLTKPNQIVLGEMLISQNGQISRPIHTDLLSDYLGKGFYKVTCADVSALPS